MSNDSSIIDIPCDHSSEVCGILEPNVDAIVRDREEALEMAAKDGADKHVPEGKRIIGSTTTFENGEKVVRYRYADDTPETNRNHPTAPLARHETLDNVSRERRNRPKADRLRPWGPGEMILELFPNEEEITEGGVIMGDNRYNEDIPSAGRVISHTPISHNDPADFYQHWKHHYWPEWMKRLMPVKYKNPYPLMKVGINVFLSLGAGDRWYDERVKKDYCRVHARHVRGDYDSYWTGTTPDITKENE